MRQTAVSNSLSQSFSPSVAISGELVHRKPHGEDLLSSYWIHVVVAVVAVVFVHRLYDDAPLGFAAPLG